MNDDHPSVDSHQFEVWHGRVQSPSLEDDLHFLLTVVMAGEGFGYKSEDRFSINWLS